MFMRFLCYKKIKQQKKCQCRRSTELTFLKLIDPYLSDFILGLAACYTKRYLDQQLIRSNCPQQIQLIETLLGFSVVF